ncbi:hypothetical protein M422DRAFT_27770 [Sphaerobolus stellatus SS14]|nr:hypothetical protein M422DRAFT_27770 [Sphaerobolus stellatus SS14]
MRLLQVTVATIAIALWALPTLASSQIPCLQNSTINTLEALVKCYQTYTVPAHYYADPSDCVTESAKYAAAQPSPFELEAWKLVLSLFLQIDDEYYWCPEDITDAPGLQGAYSMSRFEDVEGQSFCVLSEKHVVGDNRNTYARGWGLVVVPATKAGYARSIHFSVPHPIFDGEEVAVEAAALFKRSGAKSLLISGRHRQAYPCPTNCSGAQSDIYYKTDPTHEVHEVFHSTLLAIAEWQARTSCVAEPCGTFIQLHGKANDHCGNNNMFLSGGIKSPDWYTSHPSYPVNLLKNNINVAFNGSLAISPVEDGACDLTATRNVFARFLNGIPPDLVCSKGAAKAKASGHFIHIEQHYSVMSPKLYDAWTEAIKATFPNISAVITEANPSWSWGPRINYLYSSFECKL